MIKNFNNNNYPFYILKYYNIIKKIAPLQSICMHTHTQTHGHDTVNRIKNINT